MKKYILPILVSEVVMIMCFSACGNTSAESASLKVASTSSPVEETSSQNGTAASQSNLPASTQWDISRVTMVNTINEPVAEQYTLGEADTEQFAEVVAYTQWQPIESALITQIRGQGLLNASGSDGYNLDIWKDDAVIYSRISHRVNDSLINEYFYLPPEVENQINAYVKGLKAAHQATLVSNIELADIRTHKIDEFLWDFQMMEGTNRSISPSKDQQQRLYDLLCLDEWNINDISLEVGMPYIAKLEISQGIDISICNWDEENVFVIVKNDEGKTDYYYAPYQVENSLQQFIDEVC